MNANRPNATSGFRWDRGMTHFAIAAAILIVSAASWDVVVAKLGLILDKEPVPWPPHVRVNPETFNLETLPERLGRFEMAPGSEQILEEEMRETLGTGTPLDKSRVENRRSNWYVMRTYRDTTRPNEPFSYWRLDITYYTGTADLVPHIGERCILAGGGSLIGRPTEVTFPQPMHVPPEWEKPLVFERTRFEQPGRDGISVQQYVQYHIFSLDGEPESNWMNIRASLSSIFGGKYGKYSYFAKIQFAPLHQVREGEVQRADEAAAEFMRSALPSILAQLPRAEDMARLHEETQSKGK